MFSRFKGLAGGGGFADVIGGLESGGQSPVVFGFNSAYDVLGGRHKSMIFIIFWFIRLTVLDDEASTHWLFSEEGEVAQGGVLAKNGGDKPPQFC